MTPSAILFGVLLIAATWFAAYSRHLRQTVRTVQSKLAPTLPSGQSLDPLPLGTARYTLLENLSLGAVLLFGVSTLPWAPVLLVFGAGLLLLTPLFFRLATPRTGSPHYFERIRRALRARLARSARRGDRADAAVIRIALERLDKSL